MNRSIGWVLTAGLACACLGGVMETAQAGETASVPSLKEQAPNTWVKRSPLPGGPASPRLGYEASWAYDPRHEKMIRWGAHDPGGGGPQLTETWTFDINSCEWEFKRTNNNPPGNCCCRENVFDPRLERFVRFSYPAFGHGWYWDRSRFLREDSVWTYDLTTNRWQNMRPGKEPALNVGKPAFPDPNHHIIWVHDTKLRTYDPYTNAWETANLSPEIGKRTYAGMALDPERNKIVLFGDHYKSDPRTWVYDIAADEWIDIKPSVHPPGIRSCPTMVYDSLNKRMILVVLADRWDTKDSAKRRMETWTYDLGTNTWTKMNPPVEPDYSGTRGRLMRYLPDKNIVMLEGRTKGEQQIWTYRLAHHRPEVTVPPPEKLSVVTADDGKASLAWRDPMGGSFLVKGYRVYRGTGEVPWRPEYKMLTKTPIRQPRFEESGLKRGTIYSYYVTTVTAGGRESRPSEKVRAQPRVILDSRVDVLAKDRVVYTWPASPEKDVVGYVVERAVLRPISAAQKIASAAQYTSEAPLSAMVEKAALSPFERLTPEPIARTSLADTVDLAKKVEVKSIYWQPYFAGGKGPEGSPKLYDMTKPGCPFTIYAYRVRAVNRLGVESGPSPYQMAVPNEVEGLFSKEVGENLHLKWQASPHQGIKGYLVFRLDGRYSSKVRMLTPKPVEDLSFVDPQVGGRSRRYYIVVVDAIGQQGLPSHGAWGFRPWRSHYAPWVPKDGWHQ